MISTNTKNIIKFTLIAIEIIACITCLVFGGFFILYGGIFYVAGYSNYTSQNPPGTYALMIILFDIALILFLGLIYLKNFNIKYYKTIRLFLTPMLVTIILLISAIGFLVSMKESSDYDKYYLAENVQKRQRISEDKKNEVNKLEEINKFVYNNVNSLDLNGGVYRVVNGPIFDHIDDNITTILFNPNINEDSTPTNQNQSFKILANPNTVFNKCKNDNKISTSKDDNTYSFYIEINEGKFFRSKNYDFANIIKYQCLTKPEAKEKINSIVSSQISNQIMETPLSEYCNIKKQYVIEKKTNDESYIVSEISNGYTFNPGQYYRSSFSSFLIAKNTKINVYDTENNETNLEQIFTSTFPINVQISSCLSKSYQDPKTLNYIQVVESIKMKVSPNQYNINYEYIN